MAPKKKVSALIKLQIQAGKANPAPPLGPALGSHGVNIMDFCKAYNAQTQDKMGQVIPVEITVYEDRSFTFVLKTPPAAALLKKALALRGHREPADPQGRLCHQGAGSRNRREQDGRSVCSRYRGRHEDHRGHRSLDGHHGYGLIRRRTDGKAFQEVPRSR